VAIYPDTYLLVSSLWVWLATCDRFDGGIVATELCAVNGTRTTTFLSRARTSESHFGIFFMRLHASIQIAFDLALW